MAADQLKIAFVRRGYSSSGGAESYLKRLAQGVCAAGHQAQLFTTREWPKEEWPFGPLIHLGAESPIKFADELEQHPARSACDVMMSLERVWSCDVYRAGDGVHRAWLNRRAQLASPMRRLAHALNRKHLATLRLEQSLFGRRGAARVIANSEMVKKEITELYGYPADQIDLVQNGVPIAEFRDTRNQRTATRADIGLEPNQIALLFVGSGWERKGLRYAIRAVESCQDERLRLFVIGRGDERDYRSPVVQFLGVRSDLAALYRAADMFLLPTIYDPFSNASLEAIAAGIPVITTRGNGCAEIVEEGVHGSVVDQPDNIPALERAVQFWADTTRREEARPRLYELAARFDISVNVARTLEILLQAASAVSTSGKMRNT